MSIRITDSYLSSIMVGDLNRSLTSLLEQQRMAGSLQRVNSYTDDPRAVSTIQRINSLLTMNDSYLGNISRSRTLVDGTDIALQDLSEILADARVIALRESSSQANDATMGNAAFEVETLVGRMLEVLNSSIEGQYLFAGQRTDTAPFVSNGGSVIYQGDSGLINGRTGPHSTMSLNIPGDVFMGSQAAGLFGSVNMGPALRDTTLLADLNLGEGWQPGSISITVGNGTSYKIDLSEAVTVGDIVSRIQTDTKGTVTAAIGNGGRGLVLGGNGPLTVGEIEGGGTAGSLGINLTTDENSLQGHDVRSAPDSDTLLSDIPALSGHLPLGTIEITTENGVNNIDLGGARTLADLQGLFASSPAGVALNIQDGYLQVTGPSSAPFTIRDFDGTGTSTALGIAGEGTPVRLFGVMEDLQAALTANDKDAVASAIGELLALGRTLSGLLVQTGGRQNDLDWAEGIMLQRDERLRANLSLEKDVDVARVAADLSRAQASYQASLLVTSKLFGNNLMQYLR